MNPVKEIQTILATQPRRASIEQISNNRMLIDGQWYPFQVGFAVGDSVMIQANGQVIKSPVVNDLDVYEV